MPVAGILQDDGIGGFQKIIKKEIDWIFTNLWSDEKSKNVF